MSAFSAKASAVFKVILPNLPMCLAHFLRLCFKKLILASSDCYS